MQFSHSIQGFYNLRNPFKVNLHHPMRTLEKEAKLSLYSTNENKRKCISCEKCRTRGFVHIMNS